MRLRDQDGASLIELIIATALFSLILSMVTVALGRLMRGPQHANIRMQAHALAEDLLESLKTEPYAFQYPTFAPNAINCDCSGPAAEPNRETLVRNHHAYRRQTCVAFAELTT